MDKALVALALAFAFGTAIAAPPVHVYRIVGLQVVGGGTMLTIGAGKRDGLDERWSCWIVDDKKNRIENGDLGTLDVRERTTRALSTKLTPDQISKHRHVRCDVR